jgi:carboxymethylenebutenolidase
MPVKQEIIDLYDSFTHGDMSRRAFLDRLAALAGGSAAATLLLPLLKNDYALAQTVAEDDLSITTEMVPIIDAVGTVHGYLVVPQSVESVPGAPDGLQKAPAVLVIHENRGLNPHIKDVARRFAKEGFVALAVDLLSLDGGTPEDEDEAREMIRALDPDVALNAAMAAVAYLKTHPNTTGPVGVVGFCWGGSLANRLAASDASIQAVVI